ncbi:MAG: hypothetical protein JNM94_03775 [Phycisphaerae bacterium]|nr:hypothetical protein [Phycisphaerae bacterium]
MSRAPSPSAPTVPSTGDEPQRLGQLESDRLCRVCLHQLAGQIVYRDRRLDIPFVRCPECGTNAAVTEYPVGGRWIRRFGSFLATILMLLAFACLAADVAASSAATYEASWSAVYPYEEVLRQEASKLTLSATSTQQQQQSQGWWAPPELVGNAEILQQVGSRADLREFATRRFFFESIPAYVVAILSGVLWSVLLLHRPLRWAWLWLFVPAALSLAIVLFVWWVDSNSRAAMGAAVGTAYRDLAYREYGFPYLVVAAGLMVAIRIVAFILARPVTHALARVFLPTKFRRAVADLWRDEKPPVTE